MHTVITSPIQRPSLVLLGTEPWRAAFEYLSHRWKGKSAACGDGHTVIIFPGLGADGKAVGPLRDHCRSLGYACDHWGRGYNTGPPGDIDSWMAELAAEVRSKAGSRRRGAITLIGWSLGGLYAREVAKLLGGTVRQVITIGTPFNADADHTNVGWLFRLLNGSTPTIDSALSKRLRTPPSVPTTSIYSRTDGVVAWETCCHARPYPHVEDIEVIGSHIGMGWNPSVMKVVADRLSQRPGKWQPYRGSGAQ